MTNRCTILRSVIAEHLREGEWISPRELAERMQVYHPTSVRAVLIDLHREGICDRETHSLGGPISVNFYRVKQSQPAPE
ncbi:hypothetical protein [Bradyrhizobium sp. SZCCHNR2012]|uniref:hypothetical protein n=1 Tax=Bradyrhizobium sp. SZCCHNR2012 TaxID=3057377 RepID=UPI0028E1C372|nr:hypothetical protein [Bradyrhizobium sp. SZCCHNR2012]